MLLLVCYLHAYCAIVLLYIVALRFAHALASHRITRVGLFGSLSLRSIGAAFHVLHGPLSPAHIVFVRTVLACAGYRAFVLEHIAPHARALLCIVHGVLDRMLLHPHRAAMIVRVCSR